MKHISVLKDEIIYFLQVKDNGLYVDATLGGGGHTIDMLSKAKNVHVYAFDVDVNSINEFKERSEYKNFSNQITIFNENFSNIKNTLHQQNIMYVDGVIADLGWSSDQLESIPGLSYQQLDQDLDMRFDKSLFVQAKDILNTAGKDELSQIFYLYADFRGNENQKLVDAIRKFRSNKLFAKVKDLVQVCDSALNLKRIQSKSRRHTVYSRVFQALRVRVNNEYENLKRFLVDSLEVLKINSRMCIITFQSGEEKIVLDFIKRNQNSLKILSQCSDGNFVRPSIEELTKNLRSRSAKLFVVEKV